MNELCTRIFNDLQRSQMEPPVPRTSNHLPGAFLRNIATQEDHLISANKKFTIGRAKYCTLIIGKEHIMRRHGIIKFENKTYRLYVIGTGTIFLNLKKLTNNENTFATLNNGDHLSFGLTELENVFQFFINPCCLAKIQMDIDDDQVQLSTRIVYAKIQKIDGENISLRDAIQILMKGFIKIIRYALKKPEPVNLEAILFSLCSCYRLLKKKMRSRYALCKVSLIRRKIAESLEVNWNCIICQTVIVDANNITCNHVVCRSCKRTIIDIESEDIPVTRCLSCKSRYVKSKRLIDAEIIIQELGEFIMAPHAIE